MTNWLQPKFENIPVELLQQPWGVWIAEPRAGNAGKYNKAPRSPQSGRKIGANDPSAFGTFEEAMRSYEQGGFTGVGVLLTGNGIVGFDIDNASETFKQQPEVRRWVAEAIKNGIYCELSPSATGLRLFTKGCLVGSDRKSGSLEIYDDKRFLTVTGHVANNIHGGDFHA